MIPSTCDMLQLDEENKAKPARKPRCGDRIAQYNMIGLERRMFELRISKMNEEVLFAFIVWHFLMAKRRIRTYICNFLKITMTFNI